MSYQNRVDPWGNIVAASERGTLMGNRGNLHNNNKEIIRNYQTKRWIICRLEFNGNQREIMAPGLYTELFFLDEATALSAGHRPCAECQRDRYDEFKRLWLKANPILGTGKIQIEEIDKILHQERYASGEKVTFRAKSKDLPDGVFFSLDGAAYLINSGRIYHWSFGGYSQVNALNVPDEVDVLTPRSIVNAYEAGFLPGMHLNRF